MRPEDQKYNIVLDNGEFWWAEIRAKCFTSLAFSWFLCKYCINCKSLFLVFCLCRMSVDDFCRNFSDLDICCSDLNFLAGSYSSSWKSEVHRGQWVLGTTAGGCSDDIGHPTLIILQLFFTRMQLHISSSTAWQDIHFLWSRSSLTAVAFNQDTV